MSIMLREIRQQPRVLERTFQAEHRRMTRFAGHLRRKDIRLIVLVARGTSDNAALFARYLLEITTGIPVSLSAPSIHTLYRRRLDLRNALVVGISQSGEGQDINVVLDSCRKSGAHVAVITNNRRSSMVSLADETFVTRAGPERSVAATKTYTSQLLLCSMFADALAGGDYGEIRRIPDHAEAALGMTADVDAILGRYRFMDYCSVVGRGINYASACEFAIKLMETCYVIAQHFSSADFLHGPIAVVERDFPVFLFAAPGKSFGDLHSLARKLKGLQADSLIISSEPSILKLANCALRVPVRVPELYSPIPYIIPAQILAARLAELKGLNPDRPRGLTKVTHTL